VVVEGRWLRTRTRQRRLPEVPTYRQKARAAFGEAAPLPPSSENPVSLEFPGLRALAPSKPLDLLRRDDAG